MFSSMAAPGLSTHLLERLETAERIRAALELQPSNRLLPMGVPSLDDALPHHGLAYGQVIELQVRGASGAATSFALCACRAAQNESRLGENANRWCAFIDPSATLFAPGIAQLGVDLDRLLVVRPDLKSVGRVAVRIAEAKVASMLVIDLRGAFGDLSFDSHEWQRTVRKLSLIIKQLSTCVLLITKAQTFRALPLPVAMRLEFTRLSTEHFELRVGKERTGRIAPPRSIGWSAFAPLVLSLRKGGAAA